MSEKYDIVSETANNIVVTASTIIGIVVGCGGPLFISTGILNNTMLDALYSFIKTLGISVVIAMLFGLMSGLIGMKMKRLIREARE